MPNTQLDAKFYAPVILTILLLTLCGSAHSTSVAVLESKGGFVILADSKQGHEGSNVTVCGGEDIKKVFIVQNRFALSAIGIGCIYMPPSSPILADFSYNIDSTWVEELQRSLPKDATMMQVVMSTEAKFSDLVPRLQRFLAAGVISRDDTFEVFEAFITFVVVGYDHGTPSVSVLRFYINWDTQTFVETFPKTIQFENRFYVFGAAQAVTDILNPDSYAYSQAASCCPKAASDLVLGRASLNESAKLGRLLVKIEEKINPEKVGGEITGVQILPSGNAIELANPASLTKAGTGKKKQAHK